MFGLAAGFYETYLAPPEVNILILGNASSGKTALLERIKVVDFHTRTGKTKKMLPLHKINSTIGLNIAKLSACGCKCVFWDVGGQEKMRPLWEKYYNDIHAIIFVIDSTVFRYKTGIAKTDLRINNEMMEIKQTFQSVWNDDRIKYGGMPILLFASKRDEDGVSVNNNEEEESYYLDIDEIAALLETWKNENNTIISTKNETKVFGGSAVSGNGVESAVSWLLHDLKRRHGNYREHSI